VGQFFFLEGFTLQFTCSKCQMKDGNPKYHVFSGGKS
jgi:hypothetical protein